MSVIWANVEAKEHVGAIVAALDPEHPDPRAPRAASETLVDWVCRFTDVRLDSARMEEIAVRELGATAERVA